MGHIVFQPQPCKLLRGWCLGETCYEEEKNLGRVLTVRDTVKIVLE